MKGVSQVFYGTSEQQKQAPEPKQLRVCKNTQTVFDFLEQGSPFNGNLQLGNTTNGLTAYESANVDSSRDLGLKFIESMSGKLVADFVFRRKQQAVQITTKQNLGGDCKRLDSTFLFQWLISLAKIKSHGI